MTGPYREAAKPEKLPLFNVNIAYEKDDVHSHVAQQIRAEDRLQALERAITAQGVNRHAVWSWDVIKMEDE